MIIGTGIDLIETDRVAEKIGKDEGFREYVFSLKEIDYCESKTNRFEHYAARFAAKEALLKAMGTGLPGGLVLNEISIVQDEAGKPYFEFDGASLIYMQSRRLNRIHLSITHLKSVACGMVVIEQE
jgi:holo-[acyl-carrier protein] synthase